MSTAHISGNFYKYHDLDSEYVERHSSISVADFSVHLHSVECIFNCWNQVSGISRTLERRKLRTIIRAP